MKNVIENYKLNLIRALNQDISLGVIRLGQMLYNAWKNDNTTYICGNGGSAGNAIHAANDLLFGAGAKNGLGLKVEALPANSAVITCLANDIGYENIFAQQIDVKANNDDLLIVLSGSGNSKNIINAINAAKEKKMKIFGILGFDGGECKKIVNDYIHININDMQICEDMQMISLHMCMQWLSTKNLTK